MFNFISQNTTFQKLIDEKKFWKKIETNTILLFSGVFGGKLISEKSNTTFTKILDKTMGIASVLSGYYFSNKIAKSYDEEIKILEESKKLVDRHDMFIATADIKDIHDTETWTNIAIIDKNNIDISTGCIIHGSNPKRISNSFTLEALLKKDFDKNGNISYLIVGKQIQEGTHQLFSKFVQAEDGLKIYTNQIIDDVPIIIMSNAEIYEQMLKDYGTSPNGESILEKALLLPESIDTYIKNEMMKFSPSFFTSLFGVKNREVAKEEVRLKKEYSELQTIASEYYKRIEANQKCNGEFTENSSSIYSSSIYYDCNENFIGDFSQVNFQSDYK